MLITMTRIRAEVVFSQNGWLIDKAQLQEHGIHDAVGIEELGDIQQGNELRHRDGQNQNAAPQSFLKWIPFFC